MRRHQDASAGHELGLDRLHGRRELARVALLELAVGPRSSVAELAKLLAIDPADLAAYWDGHTAIPALRAAGVRVQKPNRNA